MRKNDENTGLGSLCSDGAKFFQIFRIQDGWMALAKEEPFSGVNDPLNEGGELWYAFGTPTKMRAHGSSSNSGAWGSPMGNLSPELLSGAGAAPSRR